MSNPKAHERTLILALTDATLSPEIPAHRSADLEAAALLRQMRKVEVALISGYCPIVTMMALCQQALRCAAVGYAQGEARDAVVDDLITRTVGKPS
jgi:hypothetical protein